MKVYIVTANFSDGKECVGAFSSLGKALSYIVDFDCKHILWSLDQLNIIPQKDCSWANICYKVTFHKTLETTRKEIIEYCIYEQEIDKDEYKD